MARRLTVANQAYRAALKAAKPKKRAKYGNHRVSVGGIVFASKREARRWSELQLCEKAKDITCLQRQVKVHLISWGGAEVGIYVADFAYRDRHGNLHYEDAKGHLTALCAWKLRHVKSQYGIDVRLV